LEFYQYGGHFRHLIELYEKGGLTSAINRVVEDINRRFTIDILTKDFVSNDLAISAKNLRKDRNRPTKVLDQIDKEAFTEGLRKALEIINKSEQTVVITDDHRREIKEYLDLLDLTVDIPTEFLPVTNKTMTRTAISQPGLRYAQAEAFIRQLLLDEQFRNISAVDRGWISERILDEIRCRMMEDIVLLETRMARPDKHVFRLQFSIGEFDMVVADLNMPEWQINKILITGTRCPLMPQDAAFCAVLRGSNLSHASQNEIHHSAKRGKMRQIEAAKSSRKVVKRVFSTTEISASRIPYAELPGQQKNRPLSQPGSNSLSTYPARNILLFIFVSSCLPISFSCSFRAFSNSFIPVVIFFFGLVVS
jgi:hypothetical protein